jgi:hypothetical protein
MEFRSTLASTRSAFPACEKRKRSSTKATICLAAMQVGGPHASENNFGADVASRFDGFNQVLEKNSRRSLFVKGGTTILAAVKMQRYNFEG